MRRVVITGAAGFVGRWLAAEHLAAGHAVIGVVRDDDGPGRLAAHWREALAPARGMRWVAGDLGGPRIAALEAVLGELAATSAPLTIVHLAAVSSGLEARRDPERAWEVNALGTVRLLGAVERCCPTARFVLASTGEVYGAGLTARATEDLPLAPASPYAASKAAAELALLDATRRAGIAGVIARPFQQTGRDQRADFVVPTFLARIRAAMASGARTVAVGNLAPRREFVDVRDAARALFVLATDHRASGTYNIRGVDTVSLAELFERCARVVGWACTPVADPALFRAGDIPYLAGDGARLAALGWSPHISLDETLADMTR